MSRMVGFLLLIMGLFILFQNRGGGLKWGIGFTAVGILFLLNKVYRRED